MSIKKEGYLLLALFLAGFYIKGCPLSAVCAGISDKSYKNQLEKFKNKFQGRV